MKSRKKRKRSVAQQKHKGPVVLHISYWPLLTGEPGLQLDVNSEQIQGMVDKLNEYDAGGADGCLWAIENDQPVPVLILDRAKEVADHIQYWSEQRPSDWFNIYVKDRSNKYAVVLAPNLKKSLDRLRVATMMVHETTFPPGTEFITLFRPLSFVTGRAMAFNQLREKIYAQKSLHLYLLDTKDFSMEAGPAGIDGSKFIDLGEFAFGTDEWIFKMVDQMLDDAKDPGKVGWINPDIHP